MVVLAKIVLGAQDVATEVVSTGGNGEQDVTGRRQHVPLKRIPNQPNETRKLLQIRNISGRGRNEKGMP